ncbi:MAG TPA: glycosyltransferase [Gemmatimonadaceae bacterium]|nr:glycosyltransferase [Gemmatimonadaceae bacterium]
MRALFLISTDTWSASARAFVMAARGLAARGHDVAVACESECTVQVHAEGADIPVVALRPGASSAGDAWQLRDTVRQRELDAVFVHSDAEALVAGSAVRFARRGAGVVRRIPPFAVARHSRRIGLASRLARLGLLFSTEDDRAAASGLERFRVPPSLAPLAVDVAVHDAVQPADRAALGVPTNARLIACIHDGSHPRRVLTAIRTMRLLAARRPDLHLVVLGSGEQDGLRMQGAALGVNAFVTYLGERDDELSILRTADVGWVAGDGDAAALAALDCMAFGIPIIAERTPLTEHYVADGIAGVLLRASDATSTAASVAAFLSKNDLRMQMGQAGRTRLLREFSYDAMLAGYEQAISNAADVAHATR